MYLSFGYLLLLLFFFSCFHIYPRNILFTIINSLEVRLAILSSKLSSISAEICACLYEFTEIGHLHYLYLCMYACRPCCRHLETQKCFPLDDSCRKRAVVLPPWVICMPQRALLLIICCYCCRSCFCRGCRWWMLTVAFAVGT